MRPRRRRWVAASVGVIVAAGTILATTQHSERVASPTTTTAPSAARVASTTTTGVAEVDPWTTTIAKARVAVLEVAEQPPADLVRSATATASAAAVAGLHPSVSPARPNEAPIPSLTNSVSGRRRTPSGWELDNPTSFGGPAVVVVTEDHGEWLRVLVPVRPNGSQGWVRRSDVTLTQTRLHVSLQLSSRRLRIFDGTQPVFETPVVVGAARTPTPTGRYYITDFERRYAGSAYGPWILALSAFSQALDTFAGGAPVVAIHGTNHPELVGQARSNGCVRLPDAAITVLHDMLPLGTPVDIAA